MKELQQTVEKWQKNTEKLKKDHNRELELKTSELQERLTKLGEEKIKYKNEVAFQTVRGGFTSADEDGRSGEHETGRTTSH